MNKDLYIIFGPPGSGKTTQSELLASMLKLDSISWGKIYRRSDSSSFSQMNKQKIKNEKNAKKRSLIIANLIKQEFLKLSESHNKGIILDGFPKRKEEAELLLRFCKSKEYKIKSIISLNPRVDTCINRVKSRLICKKCGKQYDQSFSSVKTIYCNIDNTPLIKEKISIKEIKEEFKSYINESQGAISKLLPYSETYFTINGDDDSLIIFSNILIKMRNSVKDKYRIFEAKTFSNSLFTQFGKFKIVTFQSKLDYSIHIALIKGRLFKKHNVLTRIHSSCITGDIFASNRCECGEQLHKSLKEINKNGEGILIYLFQEGRGINIINKIDAYRLQDRGFDTVEANEKLGFPVELREYDAARDILKHFSIKSVRLLTNNPDKVNKITDIGIVVSETVPIEIAPNPKNKRYLKTKKTKNETFFENDLILKKVIFSKS